MQRITTAVVSVTDGAGGTVLKPETGNVGYMKIENKDAANPIYVHHGDDAPTVANGSLVAALTFIEINPANGRIDNRVIAIATGAAVLAVVDRG